MFYACRQVLRDHLRDASILAEVSGNQWDNADRVALADVSVGVNNEMASSFLRSYVESGVVRGDEITGFTAHIMRYLPMTALESHIGFLIEQSRDDITLQSDLFREVERAHMQRGIPLSESAIDWARRLAGSLLESDPNLTDEADENLNYGAYLAGQYEAHPSKPLLRSLASDKGTNEKVRHAAFQALTSLDLEDSQDLFAQVVSDSTDNKELIEQMALSYVTLQPENYLKLIERALPYLSYNGLQEAAMKISNEDKGVDWLLGQVEQTQINPQLLLESKIERVLNQKMSIQQREQYQSLTDGVRRPDESLEDLIQQYSRAMVDANASVPHGESLFAMHCATCHQIAGEGSDIGPQLDGIANWGRQALTEKVFAPNRNISKAFVNYDFFLNDGSTVSGLFRREEGEYIVLANVAGQEFNIDRNTIERQMESPYTLMPDNFKDILSQEEFEDLVAFLLEQTGEL